MTTTTPTALLLASLLALLTPPHTPAQTTNDLPALRGLAPVTILAKSPAGTAALAANFTVTGALQTGALRQATLLPFADQQQQALRDAFITDSNLAQLADGLGTTLGAAYLARAHCQNRSRCTDISPAVAHLIAIANNNSKRNSNAAKYFFANATTDGKLPVSPEALAILTSIGGETDIFGRSYHLPAGTPGADAFGNSRPFQTEPSVTPILGPDYLNTPAGNAVYNRGPIMNLTDSPSFPSGHTTYGYTGSLLLALLVPDRYQQMIARGAEYGNDRILMGAHYAMDVLGGRTLALYDMAHLLANDPLYTSGSHNAPAPEDFQAALKTARADVTRTLEAACGNTVRQCAHEDIGRLSNPAANGAFYLETQTYNLPVVYPKTAAALEDVATVDPDAGYLLTAAFPSLPLDQANRILTETEGPGGGFLDNGSTFGLYSRLDLYAAAGRAAALVAAQPPRP